MRQYKKISSTLLLIAAANTFASETLWEKVSIDNDDFFNRNCEYRIKVYDTHKSVTIVSSSLSVDVVNIKFSGITSESMYIVWNTKDKLLKKITKMGHAPTGRQFYDDWGVMDQDYLKLFEAPQPSDDEYWKEEKSKFQSDVLMGDNYRVKSLEKLCL